MLINLIFLRVSRPIRYGPYHIGHTYDNLAKLWFDTQTSTDWRSVLYATNMHSADHPHECGARFPSVFIHEGFTLRRAFKTDALSDWDIDQINFRESLKNPVLAILCFTTSFVLMEMRVILNLTHRMHQFGQVARRHLLPVHGTEWSINKLEFRDQRKQNIQSL